jgi:hypothetical protein
MDKQTGFERGSEPISDAETASRKPVADGSEAVLEARPSEGEGEVVVFNRFISGFQTRFCYRCERGFQRGFVTDF